jgi:hypothetical protein
MAGFDAATAVEPMDWNFEKFGGGVGTVPEPSTEEMKLFQKDFARIMRDGNALEMDNEESVKLTEEEFEELQTKMSAISDRLDVAISTLCKEQPSRAQVALLPFRVKTAFSRWLMEQFNPEAAAAATNK